MSQLGDGHRNYSLPPILELAGSLNTLSPFVGIAGGVKYAVDRQLVFDILIEDRIRKATHQPTAIV